MIIKRYITLLTPYACVNCGLEGALACSDCLPGLISTKAATCVGCNALSPDFRTCKRCRRTSPLLRVAVASHYEGAVKELIGLLKYRHTGAAAGVLGELMRPLVGSRSDIIMPVPASTRRIRQRGYNQAVLLAKAMARLSGHLYLDGLGRLGHTRQVGTDRRQRLSQLHGQIYSRQEGRIVGASITLVDDVVTTGATLSECARVLKAAGARHVEAVVAAKH